MKKKDGTDEVKTIDELTDHKLIDLMKIASQTRKKKYKRNKETRYGNINKGFIESELKRFFSVCKNKKALLAFTLMAYLGLRIGEVVRIRAEDIYFMHRKLRISTEKSGTGDFLYLHNKVHFLLLEWVQKFPEHIHENNGYILFSDIRKGHHVDSNWLRKKFREYCNTVDLTQWYAEADDTRKRRKLYRLTTHSLRHYYITKVYKQSKNPIHTQRLARHRSFKATQTYIRIEQEDIDTTLKKVFEADGMKDENIEEFMRFYKMWKQMKSKPE